jgi:sugar O-acyltransferase (sialic acid O-acetyltransferase NeuD family)
MERLAIIGSQELGCQAAHIAKQMNQFEIVGWFDDFQQKNKLVNGYPILGKISDVGNCFKNNIFDKLFIAIGYKYLKFKKEIYLKYRHTIPFATLIHKNSIIDDTATIGAGVILYPGCIIDKNVVVEDNVLINLGSIISHDSIVNGHCFIAPGVCIAGFVNIGECCMLGIHSTFVDNISVVSNSFIGANATVLNNITISGKYIGTPAKLLRG